MADMRKSQANGQKMLNGRPNTRGATRSQRGTEKHIPPKGISANSSEPVEGLLITRRRESKKA